MSRQQLHKSDNTIRIVVATNSEQILDAYSVRSICFMEEKGIPARSIFDGNDFQATHIIVYSGRRTDRLNSLAMVQQFRQDGTNGCAKGVQKHPGSATVGIVRGRARGSKGLYQGGHARRGPICENLDSSVRLARSRAKAAHRARRRRAIYRADQGIRGRRRPPHCGQRFQDSPPRRRILGSAHGSREVLLERPRSQRGELTSSAMSIARG